MRIPYASRTIPDHIRPSRGPIPSFSLIFHHFLCIFLCISYILPIYLLYMHIPMHISSSSLSSHASPQPKPTASEPEPHKISAKNFRYRSLRHLFHSEFLCEPNMTIPYPSRTIPDQLRPSRAAKPSNFMKSGHLCVCVGKCVPSASVVRRFCTLPYSGRLSPTTHTLNTHK